MSQPTVNVGYLPPQIPLQREWDVSRYTYTELFSAISEATSVPYTGAVSISVKAFEEAMKRLDK